MSLCSRPSKAALVQAIADAKAAGYEPPAKFANNGERIAFLAASRQAYWDERALAPRRLKPKKLGTITASEANAFLRSLPPLQPGEVF